MNKNLMIGAGSLLALSLALPLANGLLASDDDRRKPTQFGYLQDKDYSLYQQECGSCHLAYSPGLMLGNSWQQIMAGLADHFGDNAELAPASANPIEAYLLRHAAEQSRSEYADRMVRSQQGQATTLRITETDYFIGKHHEIPDRLVKDNPGVKSLSQCQTCHRQAEKGDFDDDNVSIPGHGRWDD